MARPITFQEALEAVEHLPDEAQAELVEVIRRRLAERGHEQVLRDVRQARKEFAAGKYSEGGPDDLIREIES